MCRYQISVSYCKVITIFFRNQSKNWLNWSINPQIFVKISVKEIKNITLHRKISPKRDSLPKILFMTDWSSYGLTLVGFSIINLLVYNSTCMSHHPFGAMCVQVKIKTR